MYVRPWSSGRCSEPCTLGCCLQAQWGINNIPAKEAQCPKNIPVFRSKLSVAKARGDAFETGFLKAGHKLFDNFLVLLVRGFRVSVLCIFCGGRFSTSAEKAARACLDWPQLASLVWRC